MELLDPTFLTRKMLNFETGARFQLFLVIQSKRASNITLTGATKDGIFTYTELLGSVNNEQNFTYALSDFPIWLSISDNAVGFNQGDCYARIFLIINDDKVYKMCEGYVVYQGGPVWPALDETRSVTHRGKIKVITGTDQAANVEITDTVPAGVYWKLKSVKFALVTDANAATRQVHLVITDGTNVLIDIAAITTQIASLTRNYTFAPIGTGVATVTNTNILTPIPNNIILPYNYKITTVTDNKQVTDNYGAPFYWVEEELTLDS